MTRMRFVKTNALKGYSYYLDMVAYDLSHLTQPDDENVVGPIQDTEALFLYSIVRGMRMRRVLEIGGLSGYSATNFVRAISSGGTVYTVDISPVRQVSENHKVIVKDARTLTASDVDDEPLDMIFFDCHDYDVQMTLFDRLVEHGIVTESTVIALHDTNVHPNKVVDWAYAIDGGGWVHQKIEREMSNEFVRRGYHAFNLHPRLDRHDASLPYRHGVTILQKNVPLRT
jgi:predicted O-methyltransferase YrrM